MGLSMANKGSSDSLSATSGDASAASSFVFGDTNNSFQVGGSGSASSGNSTGSQTVLYVAIGLAGLALLGVFAWSAMRKA